MNSTEFGEALYREKGVMVCHGDCFDMAKSVRMGFGYIDSDLRREGLAELGAFVASMP